MDIHAAFGDASRCMAWYESYPNLYGYASAIKAGIEEGQRFYLPDAGSLLEGTTIDAGVKSVCRMPFDCTVILSETNELDLGTGLYNITVAFYMDGDFNKKNRIADPTKYNYEIGVVAACRNFNGSTLVKGMPEWMPQMGVGFLDMSSDEDGYTVAGSGSSSYSSILKRSVAHEFMHDASAIMDLCVLLNLSSVKKETSIPSEKFAKKRRKTGKPPLYSYHVLSIDGISMSNHRKRGSGSGVRSHLRRGHIRRKHTGGVTWVRPCYVHGAKDGFLDKDYKLNT